MDNSGHEWVNPSNAEATCIQRRGMQRLEKHLNPVMLVFIGKISLSTFRWVPMCQGFSHFMHYFSLAKLATSSIRVKVVGNRSSLWMIYSEHYNSSCQCSLYIYIAAAAVITHRFPEKILTVPTSWVVYRPDTYNRGEKLYYADWAVVVLLDA